MRDNTHASRRGNYSVLFAVTATTILGFGAISVDISLQRLARSQAQDIADAAGQAALMQLRRTGDKAFATLAAREVTEANQILNQDAVFDGLEFGVWDGAVFAPTEDGPNAVRVEVSQDLPFYLAPIWGFHRYEVTASSTSAARSLHVVLVTDITNSWNQPDFDFARDAAVLFLDRLQASYGPDDMVGMTVFTGRYGVEFTPLTYVSDTITDGTRDQWVDLATASKAGTPCPGGPGCTAGHINKGCRVYPHSGHGRNDFSAPADGCFPNQWREYLDEYGTDHTTGMTMARQMFSEQADPSVFRAMIVLTDGEPNGTGPHAERTNAAYDETRWRYFTTPENRNTNQVAVDSAALARDMFENGEVNTWIISFKRGDDWMEEVAQGQGYYVHTTNRNALEPIYEDIAQSLPLAVVQ